MGTLITPDRKEVFQEELDFKSGISERSWFKFGAAVNFINLKQHKAYDFKFLNAFRPLNGGEDGARGFLENIEIVGITAYMRITGVSGNTVVDCHYIRGGVDQGSIFSTPLTIANTAADGVNPWKNLVDPSSSSDTGVTLPVFSTTDLNRGDTLRMDLDSNAVSARDLSVNIHYRPR